MAWWTLYKRELSSYFHSGVAYVVLFGSAVAQSIQFLFIASKVVEIHYTEQSVMLTFFLVLWSPVALDLTALQLFSSPPPPVYWSEIWLTALTILLVGSFYVSIGVFTSALTKNQIIAAVLCFALLFIPFGVSLLKWIQNLDATLLAWVSYVSTPEHLQNAVQGIFDSRPLVYYITATILMLYLAKSVLESRRLKG